MIVRLQPIFPETSPRRSPCPQEYTQHQKSRVLSILSMRCHLTPQCLCTAITFAHPTKYIRKTFFLLQNVRNRSPFPGCLPLPQIMTLLYFLLDFWTLNSCPCVMTLLFICCAILSHWRLGVGSHSHLCPHYLAHGRHSIHFILK